MARLTRLVAAGHPHLICQAGHNRQPVFADGDDQRTYLDALREVSRVHAVSIHAYALLRNECWLLATPQAADGLSRMMQALGRRYVTAFNRRHGRTGTLWEGRFRATVIESGAWFLKAMVFVEGVLGKETSGQHDGRAIDPRTSAAHHQGKVSDPVVWDHADFWALGNTPFEREAAYNLLMTQSLADDERVLIEAACRKGWPLGGEAFKEELAKTSGRRLVPLKRGRRKRPAPNSDLSPI